MRVSMLSLVAFAAAAPASALTIHTAPFLATATNFNGFEGLPVLVTSNGVRGYTENGITVQYVGAIDGNGDGVPDPLAGIVTTLAWAPAIDGVRLWYPGAGGFGYTRVTFTDSSAIQFLAINSWSVSRPLTYKLLLDGVVIASGATDILLPPAAARQWQYFGFSDATFDEVHLSVYAAYDGGGFDAFAIRAVPVPEPATWALLAAGCSFLAAAIRRSRFATA